LVESDEEQVEILKRWWDENGTSLMTTIVLALVVVFGYRAWEGNVRETGEAASAMYENLVLATSNTEDENLRTTAINVGEELKTEHEGTAYSIFAALHLAKLAVEEDDIEGAQAQLEWVISQRPEKHLETIARMRLARILVAKGDSTAAMARLVNFEPAEGQLASWEEVRGDVFISLGDEINASQSYRVALEHLEDGTSKPLLELKLADIPVAEEAEPEDDEA
jgi:predicted negative regulator of RcsB-dependent stress response